MEDEEGNITGQSNSQSLPNNTTTRSGERTATQKLPFPILEKNDHTSAKLWWRNSKEILPQFREQLEEEIKDVFIWAIGQSAITEMTKIPYHYTDITHSSDSISSPRGTNTTVEQIFSI